MCGVLTRSEHGKHSFSSAYLTARVAQHDLSEIKKFEIRANQSMR
jgi:hypothetical protein